VKLLCTLLGATWMRLGLCLAHGGLISCRCDCTNTCSSSHTMGVMQTAHTIKPTHST
jgi:hypothetical protein